MQKYSSTSNSKNQLNRKRNLQWKQLAKMKSTIDSQKSLHKIFNVESRIGIFVVVGMFHFSPKNNHLLLISSF